MTLNDKIEKLESEIKLLKTKIKDLTENLQTKAPYPYSKVGLGINKAQVRPNDIKTGKGQSSGGNLTWNDSEAKLPPYGQKPDEPTEGYNKHGHSRFAGGALDISTLELVEYDFDDTKHNKHCQQFWREEPNIAKINDVEKIGTLDIEFDPDSKKWIAGSKIQGIDVEHTYLAQYTWYLGETEVPAGTEGAIRGFKKDENGVEMKSPLLYTQGDAEENLNKSNVIWDKEAECWRFYAVFKPYI